MKLSKDYLVGLGVSVLTTDHEVTGSITGTSTILMRIRSGTGSTQPNNWVATNTILKTTITIISDLNPTVNCPNQETEETSTPTRPVENILTTKGLQERNTLMSDETTVEK